MIERLKLKHKVEIYKFLLNNKDIFNDFYFTENKTRNMLYNNWKLIEKIIKTQECYGLIDKNLKAILVIFREKGFRTYIKLLAKNNKYTIDFLKWLRWSYTDIDLYFKLKKINPLSNMILRTGFIKIGDRGDEDLFLRKGMKQLNKFVSKDEYFIKVNTQENK